MIFIPVSSYMCAFMSSYSYCELTETILRLLKGFSFS